VATLLDRSLRQRVAWPARGRRDRQEAGRTSRAPARWPAGL